jgi:hypothetical protein
MSFTEKQHVQMILDRHNARPSLNYYFLHSSHFSLPSTDLPLKVDSNEKLKWVEKESVIDFLPETLAIEGYLQFEHAVFV